jgi:hypothetical protein
MHEHRGKLLGIERACITIANTSVVLGIKRGTIHGSLIHRA